MTDYEDTKNLPISTLQCGSILPFRQCGNTTRQADWAVQQLFNGRTVLLQDHYLGGNDRSANTNLLEAIRNRLTGVTRDSLDVYIDPPYYKASFDVEFLEVKNANRLKI